MGSKLFNLKDSMEIKIVSKSLIKPSTPTPEHLQHYKLSFFDQVADLAHLPLVLFYPHCHNNPIMCDENLEESLSRVLTHVYPVAGRFRDDSVVLCLDQGVTYVKATVNCQLDDFFLEQANKDLDIAQSFWPDGIKDVDDTNIFDTPLLVVQVTKFQCGGLALSISTAHPAMDGFTAFSFVYEWSKVCKLLRTSSSAEVLVNFMSFNHLSTLFPARDLSKLLDPPVDEGKRTSCKLIARRFVFDEAGISRLRDKFTAAIDSGDLDFKPSRVEMITSLLWRTLIRASSCAKRGHLKPCIMCFPLNLRGKVDFPHVANSFGNFIIEIPIVFKPRDHRECKMELHEFVKLIRDAVEWTSSRCAKATTPDEIVSLVVNLYKNSYSGLQWGGDNSEVENITCSSLCRFPVQKTDFGWGNPSLMHFGSRHSQVFWLHDTECDTEIAVQMDLKDTYVDFFERDQDFLSFAKS